MSWAQALRRQPVQDWRENGEEAYPGDMAILCALRAAGDRYTSSHALGGCRAMQAVYRLRNAHGADIIESVTGLGYRLTAYGREIAGALK